MSYQRKILRTEVYKGMSIEIRYCGPDVLCYVGGDDIGPFYTSIQAGVDGGERYINQLIEEKKKKGGEKRGH